MVEEESWYGQTTNIPLKVVTAGANWQSLHPPQGSFPAVIAQLEQEKVMVQESVTYSWSFFQ